MTLIDCRAGKGRSTNAGSCLAGIILRAGIPIIADCSVGFGGYVAKAGCGIAGSLVALVDGWAPDRCSRNAGTSMANVALRTGIAIVAGGTFLLGRP